ncbi:hypothetical protein [Solitalea longa]|nr:hypothetical protein [Solitalea longa]
MTVQEIHKEVFEDIKGLKNKLDACKKNFERLVLKSTRYPVMQSYACTTLERKNKFTIYYTARKRSERRTPILHIIGVYSRPEGKYAVAPTLDMNLVSIYPPHFFKRYRERILKDDSISNEEIINLYFKNDWGFVGAVINEQYESIYHSFENSEAEDKVSFVAATSQGYCFGERQGTVNILKTIISEDMLFDNQKAIFMKLKNEFNNMIKDMYGNIK